MLIENRKKVEAGEVVESRVGTPSNPGSAGSASSTHNEDVEPAARTYATEPAITHYNHRGKWMEGTTPGETCHINTEFSSAFAHM